MWHEPKVGDKLIAIHPCEMVTYDCETLTVGKEYTVVAIDGVEFAVIADKGPLHWFESTAGTGSILTYFKSPDDIEKTTDTTNFSDKVFTITNSLADLLISKNKKYGNSALKPIRVFSKASTTEQLLVRLDDKLSRLRTQDISEDEDVLEDLLGYLVLLKMSLEKDN